ncbi:MAG: VTT domain-containing protein [bacterium]|nr:VTT domain-containing protein [bacterium]
MDILNLITGAGLIGITLVIFAESGLLIGFFFPGDSLLFTAGVLASTGVFSIWWLLALATVAAIVGDSVGYAFGRHVGARLFTRRHSIFFHPEHIERSKRFFEKHGSKAIVLARFMPVVRTFTPMLAGVGRMRYPTFLLYNVIGGIIWATGVPFAGYALGQRIPNIDHYLAPIVIAIVLASIAPAAWHLLRDPAERAKAAAGLRAIRARMRRRA